MWDLMLKSLPLTRKISFEPRTYKQHLWNREKAMNDSNPSDFGVLDGQEWGMFATNCVAEQ